MTSSRFRYVSARIASSEQSAKYGYARTSGTIEVAYAVAGTITEAAATITAARLETSIRAMR